MIARARSQVPPPQSAAPLTPRSPSPLGRGTVLQRACSCGGSASLAGDCEECRRAALGGPGLAAKLRVGESGDVHEREADRIADAVVAGADRPDHVPAPLSVQRLGASAGGSATAPASVGHVLSSPGQPLDAASRAFLEPRFGHDFGQVRVHTDARAAESARELDARAYTVGRHVVFGEREYLPASRDGRRLLAHELAHVVQQAGGAPAATVQRDDRARKDDPGKAKKDDPAKAKKEDPDKPKKEGDKPAENEAAGWTRKLTDGPRLLDDDAPSYRIFFDHVLPSVPRGATQVWQVVEVTRTVLTDKCEEKTDGTHVVDVVDIGSRTAVKDDWHWIRNEKICFALESNKATVGFDDHTSGYSQQSAEVTDRLAAKIMKTMTGPKGTYSGRYTFARAANCPKCSDKLKALQKKHAAPDGEALSIDGVGSWPS